MRRFLIVLSLIIFTTITFAPVSVFAACSVGQYNAGPTAPSSSTVNLGYYGHNGYQRSNYTSAALSAGEWSVEWDGIGLAKGISSCNSTEGTYGSTSGSSDSFTNSATGAYCWCKMTEWTPSGGTTQSLAGAWVSYGEFVPTSSCTDNCTKRCAESVGNTSDFRSAVFEAVEVCTECPSKPANSSWTTGCEYACDASYYKSGDSCVDAGAGYYSPAADNNRYACTNNKPENAVFTGSAASNSCPYACDSGYYQGSVTTTVTFPTSNGTGSTYNGSSRTWSVTWSNDTASGQSACYTSRSGSPATTINNSTSSSAKYCWCKVTNWNSNSLDSKWIYIANRSSGSTCRGTGTTGCAYYCSDYMRNNSSYRSQMFATVTNTPTVTTTGCQTCPNNGSSNIGSTAITQCYQVANTNYTDSAGTYHFTSNCYYTE